MNFARYIRLFRKWFWLILLGTSLAGAISFVLSSKRPSLYQAETLIAIGSYIQSPNPNSADISTGIDLARTYAQLVTTYDILQETIETLNLSMNTDQLRSLLRTQILAGTSLLVINVTYTDPVLAANIADALAEQLIKKSPTNIPAEQQARIDYANLQIEALDDQMIDARARLELIDEQWKNSQDSDEKALLMEQRNSIIDQINQASATIAQFTQTITTLQQHTNALDIVQHARVPDSPSGAGIFTITFLGAIIGGIASSGLILGLDYLDDTIHTSEEAAQTLALPVLGNIIHFGNKHDSYSQRLVTLQNTLSPAAEGYRTIRTNLLFGVDNLESKGVFVVTSPGTGEGKSLTAANLAVVIAQTGLQVLIIDCDLWRPKLHEIFGLSNDKGLTTLPGIATIKDLNEDEQEDEFPPTLPHSLQTTAHPKLWVITSGPAPDNPTELLGSSKFQTWIKTFRNMADIDVVLLDTPPSLVVTDSVVLAARAKADVLMVVDCNNTRRGAALRMKELFVYAGVIIRGLVVNRVNPRDERYKSSYRYMQ